MVTRRSCRRHPVIVQRCFGPCSRFPEIPVMCTRRVLLICVVLFAVVPIRTPSAGATDAPVPTHADVAYADAPECRLDLWIADEAGPRPLLVWIHGGGWTRGDKRSAATQVSRFLNHGISVASINYRHTPACPLPAPVHDAARAVQYLRFRAADWNIRTDRIALTGGSAGGCTSAWLLFHDDLADPDAADPVQRESTRVCAAAVASAQMAIDPKMIEPWLGPAVLQHRMIWCAVGEPNMKDALEHYDRHAERYREFSPICHMTADDPPLLMTYPADMTLPARNAGHAIHHGLFGIKVQERAQDLGIECHLIIPGTSQSDRYTSIDEFLIDRLQAP